MFKVGSRIYRFKFDPTSVPHIIKHTFEVVEFKPANKTKDTPFSKDEFRFKCLENPKLLLKDDKWNAAEYITFNEAKGSGNCIHVILQEDDEELAMKYIKQCVQNRICTLRSKLDKENALLDVINSI